MGFFVVMVGDDTSDVTLGTSDVTSPQSSRTSSRASCLRELVQTALPSCTAFAHLKASARKRRPDQVARATQNRRTELSFQVKRNDQFRNVRKWAAISADDGEI